MTSIDTQTLDQTLPATRQKAFFASGRTTLAAWLSDRGLSDHDLERYHLGMVTAKRELKLFEEHIVIGDFDLLDTVSAVGRKR